MSPQAVLESRAETIRGLTGMNVPVQKLKELSQQVKDKSEIAGERYHQTALIAEGADDALEKICLSREKREALAQEFIKAGLTVLKPKPERDDSERMKIKMVPVEEGKQVFTADVFAEDSSGNLVESIVSVRAINTKDVQLVREIARKHGLGVMTGGGLTSGVKLLTAHSKALQSGQNGAIALHMPAVWTVESHKEDVDLDLPPCPLGFKKIEDERMPIVLYKNPSYPDLPEGAPANMSPNHQFTVHGTMTFKQVRDFLALHEVDAGKRFTSDSMATVSGALSTGAQGGDRVSPGKGLKRLKLVTSAGEDIILSNSSAALVNTLVEISGSLENEMIDGAGKKFSEVVSLLAHVLEQTAVELGMDIPIEKESLYQNPDAPWSEILQFHSSCFDEMKSTDKHGLAYLNAYKVAIQACEAFYLAVILQKETDEDFERRQCVLQDLASLSAETIVGLLGVAGSVTQATFEALPKMPEEHGLLIEVRIDGQEGDTIRKKSWRRFMQIQRKLSNDVRDASDVVNDKDVQSNITAIELLDHAQYLHGLKVKTGGKGDLYEKYKNFVSDEDDKLLLYVRIPSDLEIAEFSVLSPIMASVGISFDEECEPNVELDEATEIYSVNNAEIGNVVILKGNDLVTLDEIRHHAPEDARAIAKEVGNKSQSLDVNVRFSGTNEENERAMDAVADLCAKYQHDFFRLGAFIQATYGHGFPGVGSSHVGGGFGPHLRVTLKLNDPATRYSAPELANLMSDLKKKFNQDLTRMDGVDGIQILVPEKGQDAEYWQWMRIYKPEKIDTLEATILKYGVYTELDEHGKERQISMDAFRALYDLQYLPARSMSEFLVEDLIEEGGDLTVEKSMRAIMDLTQNGHREDEVKGMLRTVCATIKERFALKRRQYPFFIESQSEGESIIKRNFNPDHGFDVHRVKAESLDEIEHLCNDPKAFYLVDVTGLGLSDDVALMITPHEAIKTADKTQRSWVKKGKKAPAFRNIVEMFRRYPFETEETPSISAIAALGIRLQEGSKLSGSVPYSNRKAGMVAATPGPSALHESLFEMDYVQELSSERQLEIIQKLRDFMQISPEDSIAFTGSARGAMQVLAEALGNTEDVAVLEVTNGAFSELWAKINATQVPVDKVTTPWLTSENSERKVVAEQLAEKIQAAKREEKVPVLMMTPHKTSTTAQFSVELFISYMQKEYGLQAGEDYEMVCDITSAGGAVNFHKNGSIPINTIGAAQKAMQSGGLGFLTLRPKFKELLHLKNTDDGSHSLGSLVAQAEEGKVKRSLAMAMIGEKLDAERNAEDPRDVDTVQKETLEKLRMVISFVSLHDDLCIQIPDSDDQSEILVGIYSQTINLAMAKRFLAEIFNDFIGAGYTPFKEESARLYLPNVSKEKLQELLVNLHAVLQMPEVRRTFNKEAPVMTLREPHDILSFLSKKATGMTPDDVFKEPLGLHWIGRLEKTKNSGSKIYAKEGSENLAAIDAILALKDDAPEGRTILEYYQDYKTHEASLKNILAFSVEPDLEKVDGLIDQMKVSLQAITALLAEHCESADMQKISVNGVEKDAMPLAGVDDYVLDADA